MFSYTALHELTEDVSYSKETALVWLALNVMLLNPSDRILALQLNVAATATGLLSLQSNLATQQKGNLNLQPLLSEMFWREDLDHG